MASADLNTEKEQENIKVESVQDDHCANCECDAEKRLLFLQQKFDKLKAKYRSARAENIAMRRKIMIVQKVMDFGEQDASIDYDNSSVIGETENPAILAVTSPLELSVGEGTGDIRDKPLGDSHKDNTYTREICTKVQDAENDPDIRERKKITLEPITTKLTFSAPKIIPMQSQAQQNVEHFNLLQKKLESEEIEGQNHLPLQRKTRPQRSSIDSTEIANYASRRER